MPSSLKRTDINEWLVVNQEYVKDDLLGDIILDYNIAMLAQDSLFHNQINYQFYQQCKEFIAIELAKSIEVSPEDVLEYMEEFNIKYYLGLTNE